MWAHIYIIYWFVCCFGPSGKFWPLFHMGGGPLMSKLPFVRFCLFRELRRWNGWRAYTIQRPVHANIHFRSAVFLFNTFGLGWCQTAWHKIQILPKYGFFPFILHKKETTDKNLVIAGRGASRCRGIFWGFERRRVRRSGDEAKSRRSGTAGGFFYLPLKTWKARTYLILQGVTSYQILYSCKIGHWGPPQPLITRKRDWRGELSDVDFCSEKLWIEFRFYPVYNYIKFLSGTRSIISGSDIDLPPPWSKHHWPWNPRRTNKLSRWNGEELNGSREHTKDGCVHGSRLSVHLDIVPKRYKI